MKIRVNIVQIVLVVIFGVSVLGCSSSSMNCMYSIKTKIKAKTEAGKDTIIALPRSGNIVAHAFYADSALWKVISFEDAKAGILTFMDGSKSMQAEFTGTWISGELVDYLEIGPFISDPLMIVVAYSYPDTLDYKANKIYAWRAGKVREGLAKIDIPLVFDPRRTTTSSYVETNWVIKNVYPYVEPKPESKP